ncbi:AraC family transcriptional regulator [Streptomyces flavofungini]|uniref:AraC family transcriptional regulator n=1 Tax=Streptomyces flavofungini TaxID=68200 RepID=UPI0019926315|nr:AraC family transcriptional regulator [Streptomyces flavofungini]GHC57787.1 AraC family transcriptional regulator [Streptomyces flavofungini]
MAVRTPFRTSDVDEAREVLVSAYYSNFLDVLDRRRSFLAEFAIGHLGALTVGGLTCGTDVRVRLGELGAYHVNIPLSGHMAWRQGSGAGTLTTPGSAAVYQPCGDTVVDRWSGDCRVLAVKLERAALEDTLEGLLGRPTRGPVQLDPGFDTSRGPGRGWTRLVRAVADDLLDESAMLSGSLVAAPLQEALLNGLLLAAGHRYREQLTDPVAKLRPTPVKRAMDAVQQRPEYPFTTAALAAETHVGVRWLQEAFRRYVGMSPMAYVRDVRLQRVRDELRAAGPDERCVSDVAHRWGFTHLGRFAEQYRARFGELPSQTLRG